MTGSSNHTFRFVTFRWLFVPKREEPVWSWKTRTLKSRGPLSLAVAGAFNPVYSWKKHIQTLVTLWLNRFWPYQLFALTVVSNWVGSSKLAWSPFHLLHLLLLSPEAANTESKQLNFPRETGYRHVRSTATTESRCSATITRRVSGSALPVRKQLSAQEGGLRRPAPFFSHCQEQEINLSKRPFVMKGSRRALLLFWVVVGPVEGEPKGKHVKSKARPLTSAPDDVDKQSCPAEQQQGCGYWYPTGWLEQPDPIWPLISSTLSCLHIHSCWR